MCWKFPGGLASPQAGQTLRLLGGVSGSGLLPGALKLSVPPALVARLLASGPAGQSAQAQRLLLSPSASSLAFANASPRGLPAKPMLPPCAV